MQTAVTKSIDKQIIDLWKEGFTDTGALRDELLDEIMELPESDKDELLKEWVGGHIANVLARPRNKGRKKADDARRQTPHRSGKLAKSRRKKARKEVMNRLEVPYRDAHGRLKPLGDFTLEDVEASLNRWAHKKADADFELNKWDRVRNRMVRTNVEHIKDWANGDQYMRTIGL